MRLTNLSTTPGPARHGKDQKEGIKKVTPTHALPWSRDPESPLTALENAFRGSHGATADKAGAVM
jgi:hypothetical protein